MLKRKSHDIVARTPGELDAMEAAGRVVGRALCAVRDAAQPGMSTLELDEIAEAVIREAGAIPSFKGYHGFPGSICASPNEVVVHGIPRRDVVLTEGDLISIDCGAIVDGWHGDSAITIEVGECEPQHRDLSRATEDILFAGIAAMQPGNRLGDVSWALQCAAEDAAVTYGLELSIIKEFGGHGIGRVMHDEPFLPNEGRPRRGPRIQEGSVLAIEPMMSLGSSWTEDLSDGWTTVVEDGAWAAHWEHTVAATAEGPRILTVREGMRTL